MKWKRFIIVVGVLLLMMIPFISVSGIHYPSCSSVVSLKSDSYMQRINISVIFKKSNFFINCTYSLNVTFLQKYGALDIETNFNNQDKLSYLDIPIDEIQFSVSEVGSPVKVLKNYTEDNWIIPWPWDKVIVTLWLRQPTLPVHDGSSFNILLKSNVFFGSIPNMYSCFKTVELPRRSRTTPQYCLTDKCYVVKYTTWMYSRRKYHKKIKFQIFNKSVCIKSKPTFTYSKHYCYWNIHFLVESKIVMVLKCEEIKKFWCLPASWFKHYDILEIEFVEVDNGFISEYTIHVISNFSSYLDDRSQCLETTTTEYPTLAPIEWSTWNYPVENYEQRKSIPSLGIIFLIVGALTVLIVCLCCAYSRNQNERSELLNRQSFRAPQQYTDLESESNGSRARNPAYRSYDPVRHTSSVSSFPVDQPQATEASDSTRDTSYRDPPPDYSCLMMTSSQIGSSQNNIGLNEYTVPTSQSSLTEDTAALMPPPPSYEDALNMISSTENLQNK